MSAKSEISFGARHEAAPPSLIGAETYAGERFRSRGFSWNSLGEGDGQRPFSCVAVAVARGNRRMGSVDMGLGINTRIYWSASK